MSYIQRCYWQFPTFVQMRMGKLVDIWNIVLDDAPKVYNKWPNRLIIIIMMKGLHFKLITLNLHSLLPTQTVSWTRLRFHVTFRRGFGYYHKMMFGSPLRVLKTYFHIGLNMALINVDMACGMFLQKNDNGQWACCPLSLAPLDVIMDMKPFFNSY